MKTSKKVLTIILAGTIATSSLSTFSAFAATENIDNTPPSSIAAVEPGTTNNPLLVSSEKQLLALMHKEKTTFKTSDGKTIACTASWDKSYKLLNSINLTCALDGKQHEIGTGGHPFTGTFDGCNNSISGLHIGAEKDQREFHGLFGYAKGAVIENLVIKNSRVCGSDYLGGIVGKLVTSSVANCSYQGQIIGWEDKGGDDNTVTKIGGIAGYAEKSNLYSCKINNSFFSIQAEVGTIREIGGICGFWKDSGELKDCSNDSPINCTVADEQLLTDVGGIIGKVDDSDKTFKLLDSTNTGGIFNTNTSTKSTIENIGGLIGWLKHDVTIYNANSDPTDPGLIKGDIGGKGFKS